MFIGENIIVICNYKLHTFNKSNYQSKPRVWSLTSDNMISSNGMLCILSITNMVKFYLCKTNCVGPKQIVEYIELHSFDSHYIRYNTCTKMRVKVPSCESSSVATHTDHY
jgi:hypothetical protein